GRGASRTANRQEYPEDQDPGGKDPRDAAGEARPVKSRRGRRPQGQDEGGVDADAGHALEGDPRPDERQGGEEQVGEESHRAGNRAGLRVYTVSRAVLSFPL